MQEELYESDSPSAARIYLVSLAALALHQGRLHPDALVGQHAPSLLQNPPGALNFIVFIFNVEGLQPNLLAPCTSAGPSQKCIPVLLYCALTALA